MISNPKTSKHFSFLMFEALAYYTNNEEIETKVLFINDFISVQIKSVSIP